MRARPGVKERAVEFGEEPPKRGGDPPEWALNLMRRRGSRRLATLVAALIGLGLIIGVSGARVAREPLGYVGVVRNGGPLDTRTIRQVLLPGQKLTWIGFFSEQPHNYPASNVSRTYTVTSDPGRGSRPGVDVVTVPTRDGVQVGVEATVFMRFIGEKDLKVLKQFDVSYGTRRFPTATGKRLYPWQGDDGFYTWLDNFFRPVLDYDLRREIGRFDCAELVASCALVSTGRAPQNAALRAPRPANAGAIASRIGVALQGDLTRTLGRPYFWDIRMRISRVTLPKSVQEAVDDAQAKYVQVNGARAELKQARYQQERNRLLGESYNESPALANIDAIKALPKQATVILSTNGKTPAVLATPGNGSSGSAEQSAPEPQSTGK